MFQNLNKPTFGASGTNTYLGGFGNPNPNPFGTPQPFSKPATTGFGTIPSAFGQSPAPLFGSQSQTNLFGSNTNTTFGQTPTTQPAFGNTLFGQPAQPSSSGLFGATNSNTNFGQQNKPTFGFGSTGQNSVFGSQTNAQQTNSLFNTATSSGNVFGSSGSSAFGCNIGGAPTGTVIKFSHVTGTDTMQKSGITQTISTRHHCITCMKEYDGKSLEELRWEDYQANRKGQQQNAFSASPFGPTANTSTAPSLFGTQENKSVFGSPGFGQTPTFGTPQSQSQVGTGLFGKSTTTFGGTTSTPTFGTFGAPTTSNPFGNTNTVKPFGAPTSTQPIFGAPTQPTNTFGTTPFGTNTQNVGNFFKPQQQNAFPTPTFGTNFGTNTNQNSTNLFQPPKPTTGLFGQPTTQTPFQTNFNQSNTNPFGAFNKPTTSLFGNNTALNSNISLGQNTSLFGNKPNNLFGTNTNTGLFGNTNNTFGTQSTFNFGVTQNQPTTMQEQSMNNSADLFQIAGSPFGVAKHLSGLSPSNNNHEINRTTNPSELRTLIDTTFQNNKKFSPTNNKARVTSLFVRKNAMFDGLDEIDNMNNGQNYQIKSTAKRLIIREYPKPIKPSESPAHNLVIHDSNDASKPKTDLFDHCFNLEGNKSSGSTLNTSDNNNESEREVIYNKNVAEIEKDTVDNKSSLNKSDSFSENSEQSDNQNVSDEKSTNTNTKTQQTQVTDPHPTGIILQRPEYYTVPPLDELHRYINDEDGTCIVRGFTIGRVGYGNVYFLDPFDIKDLNIDELVHFRHKELTIYPDDSNKPPLGEGLNRRAQVTLDRVWPRDKIDGTPITDPERLLAIDYAGKLRRISEKHKSRFVEYRPDTGSWVFKVDHFSKYGVTEDSEDEEDIEMVKKQEQLKKEQKELEKFQQEKEKLEQDKLKQKQPQASLDMDKDADMIVTGLNTTDGDYLIEEMDSLAQAVSPQYYIQQDNDFVHSINLMKASFFQEERKEPEFYDIVSCSEMSACGDMGTVFRISAMIDNLERFDDEAMSDGSEITSDIFLPDRFAPECTQLLLNGNIIPSSKTTHSTRNIADIGIFKARSFKVGWGPGNTLLTLTTRTSYEDAFESKQPWLECRNEDDFSNQFIQHVQVKSLSNLKIDPFVDTLEKHMQIQLDASSADVQDDTSFQLPSNSDIVEKHQRITNNLCCDHSFITNDHIQYYNLVIELIIALWGDNDPYSDTSSVVERREKFSDWLEKAVESTVEKDLHPRISSGKSEQVLDNLLTYLSGYQIANASNLALSNKMPRLSLILSQVNGNEYVKSLLQTQIHDWEKQNALDHMSMAMKKLYLLTSGKPVLGAINICEDLDWKRALAMHYWYVCPSNAPLNTSVSEYELAFKNHEYAARPNPPLQTCLNHDKDYDLIFHLLKLYTDNCHPLNVTLNYSTHIDDPLDYRFSWILQQLLKSLGVGYISEETERYLHINFANQLETLGMWQWAVFVLSYLKDEIMKKHMIISVIGRNIPIPTDKKTKDLEKTLKEHFFVPPAWIYESKAIKSLQTCHYWDAVNYLTLMGDYQKAHETLFLHLIPSLFVNERYDILKEFLEPLSNFNSEIPDWDIQGGLIIDFVDLYISVSKWNFEENLHRIQEKLSSICRRVQYFPTETIHHKFCISELSKHTAVLVCQWFKNSKNPDDLLHHAAKKYIQLLTLPSGFKDIGLSFFR